MYGIAITVFGNVTNLDGYILVRLKCHCFSGFEAIKTYTQSNFNWNRYLDVVCAYSTENTQLLSFTFLYC